MHRRSFVPAALAVLAVLPACSSTEPDPTGGKTHPAGTVSGRISFDAGLIGIAVAPSGVGYVTTGLGSLGRFSTQNPYTKLSSVATGPGPRDLVIDRAGTTAYASTNNGKVYVVDLVAGTMKATLTVGDAFTGDDRINELALAPDGSRAYLTASSRVWSIPTNSAAPTSVVRSGNSIAVSPSSGSIYLNSLDSGATSRVDPSTLLTLTKTSTPLFGRAVAVVPRGDEVYVGDGNGTLTVLDPSTMAERGKVNTGSEVMGITVSPDGQQIYVANLQSTLTIVDRATRTVVSQLTIGGIPLGVAFDPQGTTAFVVNLEGWVDVIR
jgi:YVTN family beta-propeller protein